MARHLTRRSWLVTSVLAFVFFAPVIVAAESAISQGFTSTDPVPTGALVSSVNDEKLIEQASSATGQKLLGVVGKGSLVELSNGTTQVQVVTSGVTQTFVSDLNGTVEVGDPITASPLVGVGMKALENSYIVGTARANFGDATETSNHTIKDKNGNDKTVTVAVLPVQVNVSYFGKTNETKSILPQFFLDMAQTVAGKEVSVIRILTALLVLVAGVGAIGVLLYSSVRSSILSIGRNPLAASAVNKSLLEVSLLSFGILLVMLGVVYFILVA